MSRRKYDRATKLQAVAKSYAIGIGETAKVMGIPHRNISAWRAHPDFADAVQQQRDKLAEDLRLTLNLALRKVAEGLVDGKANLGHRARALEVLHKSLALVEGTATENIESRNVNIGVPGSIQVLDDRERWLLSQFIKAQQSGDPIALNPGDKNDE